MTTLTLRRLIVVAVVSGVESCANGGTAPDAYKLSTVSMYPSAETLTTQTSTAKDTVYPLSAGYPQIVIPGLNVQWSTSDSTVATVTRDGEYIATITRHGAGSAMISATVSQINGPTVPGQLRVVVMTSIASVKIVAPSPDTLTQNATLGLQAIARDSSGHPVSGFKIHWSSSDTAIATIDSTTGLARAVSPGTTEITASSDGKSDSASLSVSVGWVAIGVGPRTTCAVATNGSAYCWGSDTMNVLGLGRQLQCLTCVPFPAPQECINATPCSQAPVAVAPPTDGTAGFYRQISVGTTVACALGGPYCWGNGYGANPSPIPLPRSIPVIGAGRGAIVTLSTGAQHACGVHGTLFTDAYCWGADSAGQLGEPSAAAPADVSTMVGVVTGITNDSSIASGDYHSCAIAQNDTTYCWGLDDHGQTGIQIPTAPYSYACDIEPCTASQAIQQSPGTPSGLQFFQISAGHAQTCGLATVAGSVSGPAYCWGANDQGQLGIGTTADTTFPAQVSGGQYVVIRTGTDLTCALDAGGAPWCWGGYPVNSETPARIATNLAFVALGVGNQMACGLTSDGTAYCWGRNESGELGNNTIASSPVPVRVAAPIVLNSSTALARSRSGTRPRSSPRPAVVNKPKFNTRRVITSSR